MEENKGKKLIPPYLAYKTLLNFLDRLKASVIPTRVDRSVMSTYSGAIQAQLLTTLRYLHLIREEGIPEEKLSILVHSEGEERQKILKDIIVTSYPFLFKDGFHLKQASPQHLQDLFEKAGVSGATIRKSITFFIAMAKNAGMELSPRIKKLKFKRTAFPKSKKTNGEKKTERPGTEYQGEEQSDKEKQTSLEEMQLWLSMFPKFDPSWSDEIKKSWFEGFRDLRKDFKQKSDDDKEVKL